MRRPILLAAVLLLAFPTLALAGIAVGTGESTAFLVINFEDGTRYQFDVSFPGTSTTGIELWNIIEAETSLVTERVNFGPGLGEYIDSVDFQGHKDGPGFTPPEGFWHYWTRESDTEPWVESSFGVSFRPVGDGTWDGWVYGSAAPPELPGGAPVPEPGSAALIGLALAATCGRRRRRAAA